MADDESLARVLQAVELQEASGALAHFNLDSTIHMVQRCEEPLLQALALSLMPLEQLQAAAAQQAQLQRDLALDAAGDVEDDAMGAEVAGHCSSGPAWQEQDYLVQQLLAWFKGSFFRWTDSPQCRFCGSSQMAAAGQVPPNEAEAAHQASRTELHRCALCATITRFPRYNDVQKLLETRCGRCGEWANAFLLFCRAAGVDARYVRDWSDHVWTEYFSAARASWVHLDACEAAFDKPLLYEQGWGKQLSYVVAMGRDGVMDVTRRYTTASWQQLRQRRGLADEGALALHLARLTRRLRAGRRAAGLAALEARDAAERRELESGAAAAAGGAAALEGRQSGSEAWRSSRQESGRAGGSKQPAAKPPTAYCHAGDDRLPSIFSRWGRVVGGVCRASGDNSPAEVAACAFDGRSSTKWLDFGGAGSSGSAWIEYRLLPQQPPLALASYDVVSANDCPERDPCDWVLECLPEGAPPAAAGAVLEAAGASEAAPGTGAGGAAPAARQMLRQQADPASSSSSSSAAPRRWHVLDSQQGVVFSQRQQLKSFPLAGANALLASRRFRLRITRARDPAAATCMQLACLNLYAAAESAAGGAAGAQVPAAGTQGTSDTAARQQVAAVLQLLQSSPALNAKHLETLAKVVGNLQQNPGQARFRRIRECKIAALVQHAGAAGLLRTVGFRPLLEEAVAGQQEEIVLEADCRAEWDQAAGIAQQLLLS